MSGAATLNTAQMALLTRLANRHYIGHSRYGRGAWLYSADRRWPLGRVRLADLRNLVRLGLVARNDLYNDDPKQFPSCAFITPAGRAYLSSLPERTTR